MISRNRTELIELGLKELPQAEELNVSGKNGEELATDEASVWKRVLQYRITKYYQPDIILETHPGLGVSTTIYKSAAPHAIIVDSPDLHQELLTEKRSIIDIDPFGQPWDSLAQVLPYLTQNSILMVSNGEAFAVRRNLVRAQRYPTNNYGKRLPIWVTEEFIPRLESMTGLKMQFFYAFPTTVRVILSNQKLPSELFKNCPQWMWWLSKYANERNDGNG